MLKPRIRTLLACVGAGLLGVVLGIALSLFAARRIRQFMAEATILTANNAYQAGKNEEAIFFLGQAAAENPAFYEPWNMLGRIYLRLGKQNLALKTFKEALRKFDESNDPFLTAKSRIAVRKQISRQIESLEIQLNGQTLAPEAN